VSACGYPVKHGKLGPEMSIKSSFDLLGIVLYQVGIKGNARG
jgi:hypothetical protein